MRPWSGSAKLWGVLAGAWLAVLVVAGLALVLALRQRPWRPSRPPVARPPHGPVENVVSPADVADIDARLRGVEAEEALVRSTLIESRVRPLVFRHVPLQVVEAVPELRTIRMRFADGSTFVGHGESAGDAGVLAAALRRHTMCPASCHSDALGTHVVFDSDTGKGKRTVSMIVTGLDQAR